MLFPLWISLAFHYTKTLTSPSVSINGALDDAFLPFNNGLAFTKKDVNTCGNGVMKECGGTVDVLLFLFHLSLTAMCF